MRRLIIIVLLLVGCLHVATAQQPGWTKKATKSVFTLKTFSADGTLLGSATGCFVGTEGEALSCFTPFKGAQRAVVIDAAGKELEVECMLGANETYDVAKFRVAARKTQPLTVTPARQSEGAQVWLLPYLEMKQVPQGTIRKTEVFNDRYGYYTLALTMLENTVGAPLLNEAGELVALMQQPNQMGDSLSYAVSACFADSLKVTGLSINDPVLRSTSVKKALPTDVDQAVLALYMAGAQLDSANFAIMVNDFIQQFPRSADGYVYRAQLAADGNHFADADRDMEQALKVADKPDEVHYSYSRLIYQKMIYKPREDYAPWTYEKALEEAEAAYQLNAQPTYHHQQAIVLYAQKKYDEAYQIYETLFNSQLRSAELFYEASNCKEMSCDTVAKLALLDSCVSMFSRPYLKEAAPYLLARAQARMDAKKYRDAVNDLNEYEQLMVAQVNDRFYYIRHQAEVGGRLFQQALNDISKAIEMNPQSDLYYAEKASLQVRVGLYEDAVQTAQECIRVAPDHSDGYLFLGLAQCLLGQKAEGVKNLKKAGEMGDPQAEQLIEKYSK